MIGYSGTLITVVGVQLEGDNGMKYVKYFLCILSLLSCQNQELKKDKILNLSYYDTVYTKPGNFKYFVLKQSGYIECNCINLVEYKNLSIKEVIDNLSKKYPLINSYNRFNIFEVHYPYYGAHFYYTKNTQILLQFFIPNELINKKDTIDTEFILKQKIYKINQFIIDLDKIRNSAKNNRPDLNRMITKHDSIYNEKMKLLNKN
jgi:hypothetical protein